MPISLRCEELQPGMKLHDTLIARGRMLLQAGCVVSWEHITLLRRRYPKLVIRVGEPILDDVVEFEDDSHEREVARTVTRTVVKCMANVRERFSARASLREMNVSALQASVANVIEYLNANRPAAALLDACLDSESYVSEHPGNVFYLCMLLGSAVRDYVAAERDRQTMARNLKPNFAASLTPLGLGAMFTDLGMLPLQDLYKVERPINEEEWTAVRKHPVTGVEMLPDDFSALGKMVVRTHHENYDGTGYPEGLAGDKLHVFTRIVRIADAYDAATAKHVYKEAKSPARVLWEMTYGPYHRFYDPVLMTVFARLIQPFPIGAKLRLADGRYCVVTRYNRRKPFLPTVVIAFDKDGNRLPNENLQGPFDLEQRGDLRVRTFAGEDVSFIYRTTSIESAPPRPAVFASMFQAAFP
ncbi:MAG: HD domain-containing protein [Phycisphaerales bacterium]|nr:MAG: HD domain-containing protein [Phycisphaerales bacterium]